MKWLNRQKKRVQTIFAGWTSHFRHLQVQPCDFIAAVNSESSPEVGGGRGWWKPWGWDSGIHKDPKTIRIWGLIKHHHPSIRVKMILLPKSCAQRSTTKWLMWNFWWNRSKTLCLFAATFGQKRLSRNKLYRFFWENFLVTSLWTSRNGAWYRESFLALRNSSLSCAFPNFNLRRIFWIWPDVLFQQFSQWQQCKRVEHLFLPCLLRPWFRSYSSAVAHPTFHSCLPGTFWVGEFTGGVETFDWRGWGLYPERVTTFFGILCDIGIIIYVG